MLKKRFIWSFADVEHLEMFRSGIFTAGDKGVVCVPFHLLFFSLSSLVFSSFLPLVRK
jgi:hypothetical protein